MFTYFEGSFHRTRFSYIPACLPHHLTQERMNHDLCSCREESYINYESHNSVKYCVSIALSGLIIAHCKTVQRTFQEHTRTCQ